MWVLEEKKYNFDLYAGVKVSFQEKVISITTFLPVKFVLRNF